MRAKRTGIVGTLCGFALFASLWLLFAPVQLGGTTSYAVTEGISMLPLLHTGNLAVVHTRTSYGVGDAVLYNSPVLHRPVLHRIIAIDEGQYSLRGDNNDFTDPGTVPGERHRRQALVPPAARRRLGRLADRAAPRLAGRRRGGADPPPRRPGEARPPRATPRPRSAARTTDRTSPTAQRAEVPPCNPSRPATSC